MKHLKPFYDLKPDEITTDRLVAYRDDRDERIRTGASVVTVNRELGYLRTAMKRGAKTTPRKVNPLLIPGEWPINAQAERQAAKTHAVVLPISIWNDLVAFRADADDDLPVISSRKGWWAPGPLTGTTDCPASRPESQDPAQGLAALVPARPCFARYGPWSADSRSERHSCPFEYRSYRALLARQAC